MQIKAKRYGRLHPEFNEWFFRFEFKEDSVYFDEVYEWFECYIPRDSRKIGHRSDRSDLTVFILDEKYYALCLLKWT